MKLKTKYKWKDRVSHFNHLNFVKAWKEESLKRIKEHLSFVSRMVLPAGTSENCAVEGNQGTTIPCSEQDMLFQANNEKGKQWIIETIRSRD